MTQAVAKSELQLLVESAGGSYLAAFELLAQREQQAAIEKTSTKVTKAARQAAALAIIEAKDEDALLEMQEIMSNFVDLIHRAGDVDTNNFTDEDALQLMKEFVAFDKMDIFLKAERERIRQIVFDAVTARYEKQGLPDPSNKNGKIEVKELGKYFDKYGCGYKTPVVDEAALEDLLSPEEWDEVCIKEHHPRQVIEEHVTTEFSIEKYMKAAESKPELLEKLRSVLQVGQAKSPSFTVRPIK